MIINKDCIEGMKELDADSIDCIVTSPPYNKKGLLGNVKLGNQIWGKFNIDYDTYGDDMPEDEYQAWIVEVLNQCHRIIKYDGTLRLGCEGILTILLEPINLEEVVDLNNNVDLELFIQNFENNNYTLSSLDNDIKNTSILLAKEKLSNKPSLDLSTSVEYSDTGRIDKGTEKTNGTIGLTLTIPIFQKNIDKSDIRKYQSKLLQ